jgi:hypothetical protein
VNVFFLITYLAVRAALWRAPRHAARPVSVAEHHAGRISSSYLFLVPIALAIAGFAFKTSLALAPMALIGLVPIAPWFIARRILVPLGLPRAAYYVAYLADGTWRLDRRGGAAAAAGLALARGTRLDEGAAEWLEQELAGHEPLRGGGLVAGALLASARGDRDGARALFESARLLDDRACPAEARKIANEWLSIDAAERGDWADVAKRGQGYGSSRVSWLLGGVALCFLADEGSVTTGSASGPLIATAPTPLNLWFRWAIAPGRIGTRALVERALVARAGSVRRATPKTPAPVPEGDSDLDRALALHASLLSRGGAVACDEVQLLGERWDAVLGDAATLARLAERAIVIGAASPYRVPGVDVGGAGAALDRLRTTIEEDLLALVQSSHVSLASLPTTGVAGSAKRKLRDALLTEIETSVDAIRRRVDDERRLPPLDEWREFLAVRSQFDRGVDAAGIDFRRLAFSRVHTEACHLSVWLFNKRNQRSIGHAMCNWLLVEAKAVGDSRAEDLQAKNVACGV